MEGDGRGDKKGEEGQKKNNNNKNKKNKNKDKKKRRRIQSIQSLTWQKGQSNYILHSTTTSSSSSSSSTQPQYENPFELLVHLSSTSCRK